MVRNARANATDDVATHAIEVVAPVAIELGRQYLVARPRDAEADFAVRGRERLNEPCRIRGARGAGYAEENAHVRTLLGAF